MFIVSLEESWRFLGYLPLFFLNEMITEQEHATNFGFQSPQTHSRVKVERSRDKQVGWTSIVGYLEKYSNTYQIKQETVLTNTYELKGFKVIRRVKNEEKVLALSTPIFNAEADLIRVHVRALTDGAMGWITVTGSHGTRFLQSLAAIENAVKQKTMLGGGGGLNIVRENEKVFVEQESEAKKKIYGNDVTEEVLESYLADMAADIPDEVGAKMEEINQLRTKCKGVADKLHELNESITAEDTSALHPGFDKEVLELVQECDSLIRIVNTKGAGARSEMGELWDGMAYPHRRTGFSSPVHVTL